MEYTHIDDCWSALRHCYNLSELQATIQDFPIWSGDWDIEVLDESTVRVSNTYFDSLTGMSQTDKEDFDTILTKEAIFDLLDDAVEVEIDLANTFCASNVIINRSDKNLLKEVLKQASQSKESFKQLAEKNNLVIFYDFDYNQ